MYISVADKHIKSLQEARQKLKTASVKQQSSDIVCIFLSCLRELPKNLIFFFSPGRILWMKDLKPEV